MNRMRIVNSITGVNQNHLKNAQENNAQENEFVNEMIKKYREKEEGQLLQFSAAELIFGEGGIL